MSVEEFELEESWLLFQLRPEMHERARRLFALARKAIEPPAREELRWKDSSITAIQAQGLRRVYLIEKELLGDNRFRPCIKRGAVTFRCDFAFENIEDAKHFCQTDHNSILEVVQEQVTRLNNNPS